MTTGLISILEQNDRAALMEFRMKLNMTSILKSTEPNFMDLRREIQMAEIIKPVIAMSDIFLMTCFPDQIEMAPEIALAMIEREPTWCLPDVLNFFKTIIQRQDMEQFQVLGNKITLLRLMEMVAEYEGLKADERERLWNEKKNTIPIEREASDKSIKSLMGKELERIQIRDDKKKEVKIAPDENWFKQQSEK